MKIAPALTFFGGELERVGQEDQAEGRALYQRLSERVMAAIAAIEPPARRSGF